ncbi:UDP-N-acetylmuramoyl-L-alanyl-D-glutamate--2,6-diaminopimelate ligase [Propylenella binzhouense]|uniref:UDP-N-acetylmuramoyl-L-alanyl-D-glutamate--2,6-diaminopimelate ligase n=1 Tax=Propylenella binzhouense TaxID=2555902 RepID=A0A964WTC0_9HYPH|nr:UDP-N-acetylmuramoyl-L-alanyl-D-glutamate--2,6-diaminopimelate ligase [Propylenella binzhouense]MYZ47796.1 UDP-N-acetylmuramoyl-L-alanyl-D-glutamate--2,6-diaminopimelate ligase [Propylenella binzhouense]
MPLGDLVPAGSVAGDAAEISIAAITADSRTVGPGALFVAIPGTRTDGARFVPQALARGAAAVMIGAEQALAGEIAVPVVRVSDVRRALALAAARFYGRQPETVVAVTGTNGKTSVTVFLRQIWEHAGRQAASLGTIGLVAPGGKVSGSLTTPDPVSLQATLAGLAGEGVTHLALEASSHGLEQRRLDGVRFAAGGFTNLSRDHLDYHATLEDYFAAKLRLFDTLLPDGAAVVADADEPESARVRAVAERRGLRFLGVGEAGDALRLAAIERLPDGARLKVAAGERVREVKLPLVGRFQVSNALVAAGLAIATGVATDAALAALEDLEGASGRLELVGMHPSGARIFVDYAHTPDALTNALQALRPHTENRLVVVFGAGGDRDPGKRPLMGEAAAGSADVVIVTDDNPRTEDPALIRHAVLTGAPAAAEIGDRRAAINAAVAGLTTGDVLLVAGKGHETGQIVGSLTLPFSDQEEVRKALRALTEG